MRYFIELAYRGTLYHGWQRQKGVHTLQSEFEQGLSKILNKAISIHGCGRTDAGVHATQFFVQFDYEHRLPENLEYKLNRVLPADFQIFRIFKVDHKYHVQRSVSSRSYQYFIHRDKSPFLEEISTLIDEHLDLNKMDKAFKTLQGVHDFKFFCKQPDLYPNTKCNIKQVSVHISLDRKQLCFTIEANRFLRRMVRLIMARIIDVGKSKISVDEFHDNINNTKPFEFQNFAHPQGLFLSHVQYPFLEPIHRSGPISYSSFDQFDH